MNPDFTILTWGKLYSYIIKKGDFPLSIDLCPTNELGKISNIVHLTMLGYYEMRDSVGLWIKIDTKDKRILENFLWIPRLYCNEIVIGRIDNELYKYFYYNPNRMHDLQFTKLKLPIKKNKDWDRNILDRLPKKQKTPKITNRLQTIYQKPNFPQKQPRYDLYQKIEQQSQKCSGEKKRILIVCGLEAYMKKKTTEWVKKLYPDHPLQIINIGENGQYYFMLGITEWPEEIKGKFDLIVMEFCPKSLFNYDNLYFVYKKLKKDGFILFLYFNHRLLNKKAFKLFIDTKLKDNKQKSLTFEELDN